MRQVTIIGAGRSGRGMLGELYGRDDFHIVFADKNKELITKMRNQGYYTVKITDIETNESQERCIDNFTCIDVAEKEKYYEILNHSDIISTAILPKDFDEVIKDLAGSIKQRFLKQYTNKPMIITLGANYVGMKEYFIQGIRKILNTNEKRFFDEQVYLLMSIVNRKNMLPKEKEKTDDELRIIGDNKDILQVEKNLVLETIGQIPSWMILKDNIESLMAVKLWAYNLVQASMVAVGINKGFMDTYLCSQDYESSKWAYYAAIEGYEGVRKEYELPERTEEESKYMVNIFRNEKFRDNCYRIIRNPIRKLKKNDRFIGPALCALKHDILPYYITKCCAYMFLYKNQKDPETLEIHDYINTYGIEAAIQKYCQLNIEKADEKLVYNLILNGYYCALKDNPLDK